MKLLKEVQKDSSQYQRSSITFVHIFKVKVQTALHEGDTGDFLVVPVAKTVAPNAEAQV